jgi:ribonuclease-3 family protein
MGLTFRLGLLSQLNFYPLVNLAQRIVPGSESAHQHIRLLSPAALAYLGDAVYELHMRAYYLTPPSRMQEYHGRVVKQVRAEAQANCVRQILPRLTDEEQTLLKKGRNAATGCPKRLSPDIYRQATALETLIGYLYLTNPPRLQEVLQWCLAVESTHEGSPALREL